MQWIVVDTSYLLELFRVPGDFEEESSKKVHDRFSIAIKSGWRLYVSVPVIFELANHIADVADGGTRQRLATSLSNTIKMSAENSNPWILFPAHDDAILLGISRSLELIERFQEEFAQQAVGLTDVTNITMARELRIRADARPQPKPKVHIWTRDHLQKAHEPDREPDQFV